MHDIAQTSRRPASAWAQIALSTGSTVPILGLPIIVGALVDRWGYSAAAAGYVASSDLAGLCIGSVVTSAIAHRVNWRSYVGTAAVVCVCINLLCASVSGFWTVFGLRLGAGIASGAIYASCLLLLSRSSDAARNFSLMIFVQVIANAVVLAVFPGLAMRWGPAGLFVTMALILAATLVVVPLMPVVCAVGERPAPRAHSRGALPALPAALCLLAVALFYVTIGSYWTYAERMGLQFGLLPTSVHELLSLGTFLSGAGCLLAFWLSRLTGPSRPLLAALIALSVTLLLHALLPTATMFIVTLGILQLCWNLIDIFQLGMLAIVDPTGRSGALVPAAQGAALAAGPAAGGFMLSLGKGYAGVLLLGGVASALAAIACAIVYKTHRPRTAAIGSRVLEEGK